MKKNHKPSSKIWLQRQLKDPYVLKSKEEGYYSRAAYKLIEINTKFKLFRSEDTIIDLGASPGSWSQVVSSFTNAKSTIIAIDLLPIKPIPRVISIQADITNENTYLSVSDILDKNLAHAILSDMSSNSIGDGDTDHLRNINLCYSAFEFSKRFLLQGGNLVIKLIKGREEMSFIKNLKLYFQKVLYFKPEASRKKSREIYIIALKKSIPN